MYHIAKVLLFLLVVLSLASCKKNYLGRAADSVQELAPGLYFMSIEGGDVGFSEYLAQGGGSSTSDLREFLTDYLSKGPFAELAPELKMEDFACSALGVRSPQGEHLAGRNYDWKDCMTMILKLRPENAYASISTVNLDFLEFGEDFKPEGLINGFTATAAAFIPMDGFNEKGLMVADLMAGDNEITHQNTKKKDVTTTALIRLLLNQAANIEEALRIMNAYDYHSDLDFAHHLFLADKTGRSICAEWIQGQLCITETPVLNNHYLSKEKEGVILGEHSIKHEAILMDAYNKGNGVLSEEELRQAMFDAGEKLKENQEERTQWTAIFNLDAGTATWYHHLDKKQAFSFSLE